MSEGERNNKSSINVDKGKNILIIVLVILVILSGWRLLNDHREKSRINEEVTHLTEENNQLNTRLDSITRELMLELTKSTALMGM